MLQKNPSNGQSVWEAYGSTIALLACASFYFLCVDILADNAVLVLLGREAVLWVHIVYLLVMAGGFLSFAPLQRLTPAYALRKAALCMVCGASVAALFGFLFIKTVWLFLLCVMLCLYTAGVIGAGAYYYAAMALHKSDCTGRVCALGIGGAALLQVILMVASPVGWAGGLILTLSLGVALYVVFYKTPQAMPAFAHNYRPAFPMAGKRHILFMLSIVAVISVMGGINDGTLTLIHTQKGLNLYSFPRLFYLGGVLFAGWIADYKARRYLSISVLAVMLCATVGILFLNSTAMLNLNACIYSLFAGFAIIFFTVPFFDFAPATRRPALWAGMGRAVRLLFLALGTLLMELVLKGVSFYFTIAVFVLLSVVLVLLFYLGGLLEPPVPLRGAPDASMAEQDRLALFARRYVLTPKEREVLQRLMTTEDGVQEIADGMFISRRVLQRYISSIYEKTQTKSRIGLFQLYVDLKPE